MRKVVIVGAGISGLSLAYLLSRLSSLDITLIEKDERAGGKLRTLREDGYLVECGPNGFLSTKSRVVELCEMLDVQKRLYSSSEEAERRFLLLDGSLREIPVRPLDFFRSPLLSIRGRLRVLCEPFVRPCGAPDETVADFVRRRLGRDFVEKLIDPMVAGIYAGRAEELSIKAAFPAVWRLEREYGSLIRGMFYMLKSKKNKVSAGPSGRLMSFVDGVEELVEFLLSKLSGGVSLITGVKEVCIFKASRGWIVELPDRAMHADVAVLSVPAYAVGQVLYGMDEVVGLAQRIPYAPVAVVAMGFSREDVRHPLNGFGFLVPSQENRGILGCLWDSSIFPNRAPAGKVLLRAMVGGARDPHLFELDDARMVDMVFYELDRVLGFKGDPEKIWVFRYERGIPQYVLGHTDVVSRLDAITFPQGLFLHSNAFRGVGFGDCVASSFHIAERVLSYLGAS